MARIEFDWDGETLPEAIKRLPAGRYVVESTDELRLTEEEEQGLIDALEGLGSGQSRSANEVRSAIDRILNP